MTWEFINSDEIQIYRNMLKDTSNLSKQEIANNKKYLADAIKNEKDSRRYTTKTSKFKPHKSWVLQFDKWFHYFNEYWAFVFLAYKDMSEEQEEMFTEMWFESTKN